MKGEIWQNNQPVLTDDVSYGQTAKDLAITERTYDFFDPGIIKGENTEFTFSVSPGVTGAIDIDFGVSYDLNGERISILEDTPYSEHNPATLSPDGYGHVNIPTPISSGNKTVPITLGKITYIFLKYLNSIDPSVYTINQSDEIGILYTKRMDGYQIVKFEYEYSNLLNDPYADIGLDMSYVYLGYVDYNLSGTLNITTFNYNNRIYCSLNNNRLTVTTPRSDKTDRTTAYTYSQTVTLNDHVKSIGTGNPTSHNPHGLSVSDLGSTGKTTELHEKYFHTSGIVGDQTTETSSLYGFVSSVYYSNLLSIDQIIINPLIINEFLLIEDETIDSTLLTGDTIIDFKASSILLDPGLYTVYFDSLDKKVKLSGNSTKNYTVTQGTTTEIRQVQPVSVLTILTNFSLWSFTFSQTKVISILPEVQGLPNLGYSNFTTKTDLRLFGNISSDQLRRDSATDTFTINHNVDISGGLTATGNTIIGGNTVINGNLSVNGTISGSSYVPTGVILDFAGINAPSGYYFCDGSTYLISNDPALFGVIGNRYGGNGVTGFNVPDLRGLVSVGNGTGVGLSPKTLGQTGGYENITLTASQSGMPAHAHGQGSTNTASHAQTSGTIIFAQQTSTTTAGPSDASSPHSNMQPYFVLNKIIKR